LESTAAVTKVFVRIGGRIWMGADADLGIWRLVPTTKIKPTKKMAMIAPKIRFRFIFLFGKIDVLAPFMPKTNQKSKAFPLWNFKRSNARPLFDWF